MKLSACIVAKNEENNIAFCLQSLQDIVEEIIVVDTGSTDRTVAIAEQFHAKVYFYKWQEDFAAAKNFALEKASGDWIIFLDADEYFTTETIGNVRSIIAKHAKECDAYLLKMINIDVDNGNKQLDDFYAMRIFKNSDQLRFFGKVHEELRFVDGKRKAMYQVDESEIKLYHTGYSKKKMKLKCQRNLKILLAELKENPQNINLYRYLADVYHGLEDYENAFKYAKMDIETGKKEISYASRSYRVINNSLVKMNAPKSEIEHYLIKSIKAFPSLPDFYAEYALLKYNSQEYDEAFSLLTKAMELHRIYHDMETSLFAIKMSITYLMFGLLYQRKNDYSEAINYYQKTLEIDKYYPEAFISLFKLIQQQDEAHVIAFLNTIYDSKNQKDVEFLIHHIGLINKGKIYWYYYHKLNIPIKRMGKPVYTDVELRQIMFLTLAIILTGDKHKLCEVEHSLPINYQNVVHRYMKISNKQLEEADFAIYKNILLELLLIDENNILDQFIALSKEFKQEKIFEIARNLQEKNYLMQALSLFEHILNANSALDLMQVYYQAGICAYQIKDYVRVANYFERAIQLGYKDNDVKEFLTWSVEKS